MSPPAPNRQTRGAQSVLSHRPFGGPLVEWCGIRRDGKPPLADHGIDTDADGNGMITNHRLYQLVRQATTAKERLFEIEFLDPGVQAYVFTFG